MLHIHYFHQMGLECHLQRLQLEVLDNSYLWNVIGV